MKKIWGILILLLILMGLYLAEINLSNTLAGSADMFDILDVIKDVKEKPWESILIFFIIGFTIGSIACPACSLPTVSLAGYVLGAEATAKKAFWASVIFQAGRLLIFLPLGILSAVLNYALPDEINIISRGLAGILMILFSMELFGIVNLSKYLSPAILKRIKIPHVAVDHPLHMALWGILLGFFCSAEQLFIITVIPLVAPDVIYTFVAVLLFGLGTVMTPIVLLVLAGGSMEITAKHTEGNLRKYAKWLGGILLLYVGLEFLISGIVGLFM